MRCAIYDKSSGIIQRIVIVPAIMKMVRAQLMLNEGYVILTDQDADVYDDTHYVNLGTGLITPKVSLGTFDKAEIAADGMEAATIQGLPNPSLVLVTMGLQAAEYVVEEGTFSVSSQSPGVIIVHITPPLPYQNLRATIHAA